MTLALLALIGCDPDAGDTSGPAADSDSGPGDTAADTDSGADTADTQDTSDSGDSGETAETGPVDADGDGWVEGEDCDDSLPNVYPGAPDGCDGLDQDCDGEVIPAASCGEFVDLDVSATAHLVGDENRTGTPFLLPGVSEGPLLGWIAPDPESGALAAFVSPYGEHGEGLPTSSVEWSGWVGPDTGELIKSAPLIADADGDGAADVWQCTEPPDYGYGAVYPLYSPLPELVPGAASIADIADAYLVPAEFGWTTGVSCTPGRGDADGDGREDVLVYTGDDADWSVHVIWGSSGRYSGETAMDTSRGYLSYSLDAAPRLGSVYWANDLDGDGMHEVVGKYDTSGSPAAHETLAVVSGADLAEANGTDPADVAYFWTREPEEWTETSFYVPGAETNGQATDLDADGYPELLITTGSVVGSEWVDVCVAFLQPRTLTSSTVDDAMLTRLCFTEEPAEEYVGYVSLASLHVFPSGQGALSAYVYDEDGVGDDRLCLYGTEDLPLGGRADAQAERALCHDGSLNHSLLGDLTGDNLPEWILFDLAYDDRAGRISIIEGFDIPWDDDSRW